MELNTTLYEDLVWLCEVHAHIAWEEFAICGEFKEGKLFSFKKMFIITNSFVFPFAYETIN
jgi:hypothetical protein